MKVLTNSKLPSSLLEMVTISATNKFVNPVELVIKALINISLDTISNSRKDTDKFKIADLTQSILKNVSSVLPIIPLVLSNVDYKMHFEKKSAVVDFISSTVDGRDANISLIEKDLIIDVVASIFFMVSIFVPPVPE